MLNKYKHLFLIFLFLIIVVPQLYQLFLLKDKFLTPYDAEGIAALYSESQYVKGSGSAGIGDDGLYAFAGHYYFSGGDVSQVNFEHPPLGKYLIGLSIQVFGNENIINLLYAALLFLVTYRIGLLLSLDKNSAAVASVMILLLPVVTDSLTRSMLDLPFTVFFVSAVLFFLKGDKNRRYFIVSNVCWALAFATRFFPVLAVILLFLFVFLFCTNRKALFTFVWSIIFVPIVYLLSHISFFVYHPSIVEFIRHKLWMLDWFRGTPVIIGNIWRNVFTGWFYDPTGSMVYNSRWTPVLPALAVLAILSFRKKYLDKKFRPFLLVYSLALLYTLYVTFLTNGDEKFLMPVFPLYSVLALFHAHALFGRWFHSIIKRPHGSA